MEKQEIWKPVVGYEGLYEVSNLGRVKSLNYNHTGKEGLMKPSPDGGGYLQVILCKNGEKNMRKVHILIMRAFVGRCPDGYEVDHVDWNPKNNRLENLRYLPAKENHSRKSPEGLQNISEAAKKLHQDPEWQKNNAEAMKKLHQNHEWQKNNAEAREKMYKDPEWKKNHAEGCRKRSQNQEWRKNHSEAMKRTKSKPVNQYTLDGILVKTWSSTSEAVREIGGSKGNISECCKGKRKTAGGFIWKFAEPC